MNGPDEARYVLNARDDDGAARMVLRIKGTMESGEEFDCLAFAGGEANVLYMNSFYDVLVGRTLEESKSLPRRKCKTEQMHIDDNGFVRKRSVRIESQLV